MKSSRGVSTVVGYLLLVAITITASGILLYTGSNMIGSISDQNQNEQAQQSISQFSSEASLVALGDLESRTIDYGDTHDGQIEIRENASYVKVYVENDSGDIKNRLLENQSLGAVVYKNGDTEVAYEGGGVWQEQDEYSTMVSPPEYHYQGQTLTFPVVRVSGEGGASGSTQLSVKRLNSDDISYPNPITEGKVHVTIKSDYCRGWRQFFLERTGGSVTECDDQTVTAELSTPKEITINNGIAVRDDFNGPNSKHAEVPDNVDEDAELVGISGTIDSKVESAKEENNNSDSTCISETSFEGGCTLTNGTYFVDGDAVLNRDVDFDTSSGPIDVIVNGSLDISGQELENEDTSTNNGVQYYVDGNLEIKDSTVETDSTDIEAKRNVFLVGGGVATKSNAPSVELMDSVIYAPNADIDSNGQFGTFRGAVYAHSLEITGGGSKNTDIQYDEDLAGYQIEIETKATTITYLHLSENRIEVQPD